MEVCLDESSSAILCVCVCVSVRMLNAAMQDTLLNAEMCLPVSLTKQEHWDYYG